MKELCLQITYSLVGVKIKILSQESTPLLELSAESAGTSFYFRLFCNFQSQPTVSEKPSVCPRLGFQNSVKVVNYWSAFWCFCASFCLNMLLEIE